MSNERPKVVDRRRKLVTWVLAEVMPHEAAVRNWLRRSRVADEDIDDLIQEAYCKLVSLETVEHISRPDGYFFRIVRNLLMDHIRRSRIVRFETVEEMALSSVCSEEASPEQIVGAQKELEKVSRLIRSLPARCRQIIQLRKVEGISQKEIARRLGITESTVENEAALGMRLIIKGLQKEDVVIARTTDGARSYDQARKPKRD
jgi:RNA polymerase sigma factor (sigma-70 family)